jgi:hypothetical protein
LVGWLVSRLITSTLKVKTAGFSETLASNNQSTLRPNLEVHHGHRVKTSIFGKYTQR